MCGAGHDTGSRAACESDVARGSVRPISWYLYYYPITAYCLLTAALSRFEKMDARLEGFITHARRHAARSPARNRNGSKLVHKFEQNFRLVEAAVKAHRCLKLDFHVYLRSDGGIINVDLDRCFGHNQSEEVSLSNSYELPEPRHKDHAPGEAPEPLCRRGKEQYRFDQALKKFYERLRSI